LGKPGLLVQELREFYFKKLDRVNPKYVEGRSIPQTAGALPLDVLSDRIDAWIASQKPAEPTIR